MRKFLTIAALLALGACASGLSEEQCESGDPASFGYEDGRNGYPVTRVEDRVAQCSRYELAFDRGAYARGWEEGNRLFCTPQGALDAALQGRGDILSCPQADLLTRDAFSVGRDYARAKSNFDSARSRYDSLLSKIRSARYTIERSRRQLVNEEDDNARQELYRRIERARRDLREADNDLYYAERQLRDTERDFDRAEYDLSRIQAEIRSRNYQGGIRAGSGKALTAPPIAAQGTGDEFDAHSRHRHGRRDGHRADLPACCHWQPAQCHDFAAGPGR